MESMQLKPKDILAFILVGEYDGENYELDPEQVKRTEIVIRQIAESRMNAIFDVPPMNTRGASPPDDPNLN